MRLKRYPIFCFICLALAGMFVGIVPVCHAEYDYVNISDPFLNKIPLAVPVFKGMSNDPIEKDIALNTSDLITDSLAFTGYFNLLDRGAFLEDLQTKGILASQLNFDNWTDIGAELLITGGITLSGDVVQMEFRLYDTFKSELLFGKRYKGQQGDIRKIAHRFCSEMFYRLTGKRGIFESKIAFISTQTGNKEIFICEFDGYNSKQVTDSKSITLFPAWSPDGTSIAYTSYKKGKPNIYIRNLLNKKEKRISFEGINITPKWVPGKKRICATLSFEGDEEIYLLTETGKVDKRLTKNWGIDVSPTFSPDGETMAFVSKRSGTPQIFIKNLEKGNVRRLTFKGTYNTQPDWSPAGGRIVFSGMTNGKSDIFVIDADGSGLTQLTHDAGTNESPSWSPEGSLIVFSSTRMGKEARIFVMTASGTDQRILLELPGEQSSPSWSPAIE